MAIVLPFRKQYNAVDIFMHCTMNKTGSISGHFQKRTQIQLFQLGRITRKLPDLINLGDFGRRAIYFAFLV